MMLCTCARNNYYSILTILKNNNLSLLHQPYKYFNQYSSRSLTATKLNIETNNFESDKEKNILLRQIMKEKQAFTLRSQLNANAKRIVLKIGSAVIARDHECGVALGHLASIVEQVAEMYKEGRQVLIVTSGAVAFGKQKLKQEINAFKNLSNLYQSHHEYIITASANKTNGKDKVCQQNGYTQDETHKNHNTNEMVSMNGNLLNAANTIFNDIDSRAFAALGQSGLMALYDAMFAQYGIKIAQVLLTQPDFNDKHCRANLRSTIHELLQLKICPIVNANDVIAPPPKLDSDLSGVISVKDNDIVATHLAVDVGADLLVIMSDVDGIYSVPPTENTVEKQTEELNYSTTKFEGTNNSSHMPKLMNIFCPSVHERLIKLGQKSRVGTGGMESKIKAATFALDNGCSVVICNGMQKGSLRDLLQGKAIGTFFVRELNSHQYSTKENDCNINNISNNEILENEALKTLVEEKNHENLNQNVSKSETNTSVITMAKLARIGSQKLQKLTHEQRGLILQELSKAITVNTHEILAVNKQDLLQAKKLGLDKHLINRLELTEKKLETLATGIESIAQRSLLACEPFQISPTNKKEDKSVENISNNQVETKQNADNSKNIQESDRFVKSDDQGWDFLPQESNEDHENEGKCEENTIIKRLLEQTQISETMLLTKITVPIGVLLVIFESRPDSLLQIASLSIATGNGLILKGGKEAKLSNAYLYGLLQKRLEPYDCSESVQLVSTREDIDTLLSLNNDIDLIIPRGSKQLVQMIMAKSKGIPVMGHSEGICHVYIHEDADPKMALNIIRDSKCNYPSACNAMETLLLNQTFLEKNPTFITSLLTMFQSEGIHAYMGPNARTYIEPINQTIVNFDGILLEKSKNIDYDDLFRTEYGNLDCSIEIVNNVNDAIDHINTYGSLHTDTIVTSSDIQGQNFVLSVNSACAFHNVSTRFADGYRFGLGAEVGISTGKLHARGPVGLEGLLTYKWVLSGKGDYVEQYEGGKKDVSGQIGGNNKQHTYLHKKIIY